MTQLDLFGASRRQASAPNGEEQKAGGQGRVWDRESEFWREHAYGCAVRFSRRRIQPFTAEAVREVCVAAGIGEPRNPNSWGALVTRLAKAGEIEPCGYTRALRPEARSRVVRVWRSLVYEDSAGGSGQV